MERMSTQGVGEVSALGDRLDIGIDRIDRRLDRMEQRVTYIQRYHGITDEMIWPPPPSSTIGFPHLEFGDPSHTTVQIPPFPPAPEDQP